MRCILLLLVFFSVIGNILSHNTYTQKAEEGSFSLSRRHPEIYEQLNTKKLPIKGFHWECLDSIQYSKTNDTIIFIQKENCEGYIGVVANCKKDCISFTNAEDGIFKREDQRIFTKYMIRLVYKWDTTEIRKEEIINKSSVSPLVNYAFRIIFKGNRCSVDYICFSDFYNHERDGNDFIENFY